MKVKTRVGVVEAVDPGGVGPRAKFWSGAVAELVRLEELYGVMQTALDEAYRAGQASALSHFMSGWSKTIGGPVVDAEFEVIPNEKERSDVEGRSEELRHERELAKAASLGQGFLEGAPESTGPVSQADGSAGSEAGTSGEA